MIGWLSGIIIDKQQPGKVVINVNGVGYEVETSLQTFFQFEHMTEAVSLYIHTIVREDAFLLYGFADKKERILFRALIKVNGVGPKVAIGILSSVTPEEFVQTIIGQNVLALTRLPGIGKKTAERLVIEMKDSIEHLYQPDAMPLSPSLTKTAIYEQNEAISALEVLGYKTQEVIKVIKKIDDGHKTCEQLIRQALPILSGR